MVRKKANHVPVNAVILNFAQRLEDAELSSIPYPEIKKGKTSTKNIGIWDLFYVCLEKLTSVHDIGVFIDSNIYTCTYTPYPYV